MSKIREMLPGEYGLLDEFLYQAIHTEPGDPRPPRSVTAGPALRAYVEGFGRTGDVAVCAEEGGEVVGAAWARLMRGYGFAGDGVPELAVSVLPGHRGRGVGTALLSSLVERCSELGCPALSLSVQRSNPAVRLYERLGFREVSGDDGEAVMALPLGGRDEGARGGSPFERARAAALRVLTAPCLAGRATSREASSPGSPPGATPGGPMATWTSRCAWATCRPCAPGSPRRAYTTPRSTRSAWDATGAATTSVPTRSSTACS